MGYGVSPLQVVLGILAAGLLITTLWLVLRRANAVERNLATDGGTVAAVAVAAAFVLALAGGNFVGAGHLHLILVPLALVVGAGVGASGAPREGPLVGVALCTVFVGLVIGVFLNPQLQRLDNRGAAAALGPPASSRLILFSDDERGLYPYLGDTPPLPARGRRVSEIDLLRLSSPLGSGRSLPDVRRPIRSPVAGFVLTQVRETPTFSLVRFRSSTPRLVTPAQIRTRARPPRRSPWYRRGSARAPQPALDSRAVRSASQDGGGGGGGRCFGWRSTRLMTRRPARMARSPASIASPRARCPALR